MKKCQPKTLTPYLDGELAPDTRSQVEEHLRSCASCGALLDEVTSARERVRGMGRAVIPDTVLMPALEIFREKGGIGQARNPQPMERPPLPLASAEAIGVMDQDAATDVVAGEVDEDERYNAVVSAPGPTWVHVTPPGPVETALATPGAPVIPDASVSPDTQVIPEPPAIPDPPAIPEPPPLPEPVAVTPPADPEPLVIPDPPVVAHWPAFSEPDRADRTGDEPGALRPGHFRAIADAAEFSVPDSPPAAPWEEDSEEAISPEAQYALETAGAPLDERPAPPDPQPRPPWAEAESADAEDIEAHGRRLVEEDLEAERIRAAGQPWGSTAGESLAEPETVPEHADEPVALADAVVLDEPVALEEPVALDQPAALDGPGESPAEEEPVAATRPEPWRPHPDPWEAPAILAPAAIAAEPTTDAVVDGYRGALRAHAEEPPTRGGLASLSSQVKIGLGVAAAIVLLLAAVVGLPRLFNSRTQPLAAASTTHPSTAPSAGASPGTAAAPAPSPQASAAPVVPALTGTVSAGHAGTGYQVLRIRTRNPSPGLNLIVFDLQGPGALPDATLGQGADGSLYLQSAGTTIDPAIAAAFAGAGPVTSIAPTGGEATSLKLATSRPARFSLYYLTGPSRLVIELR